MSNSNRNKWPSVYQLGIKPPAVEKVPTSLDEELEAINQQVKALAARVRVIFEIKRLQAMPYSEYLNTKHWQEKRRLAFSFHARQCASCAITYGLDVHHLHYDTVGHEDPHADLRILCRACHEKEHKLWKSTEAGIASKSISRLSAKQLTALTVQGLAARREIDDMMNAAFNKNRPGKKPNSGA